MYINKNEEQKEPKENGLPPINLIATHATWILQIFRSLRTTSRCSSRNNNFIPSSPEAVEWSPEMCSQFKPLTRSSRDKEFVVLNLDEEVIFDGAKALSTKGSDRLTEFIDFEILQWWQWWTLWINQICEKSINGLFNSCYCRIILRRLQWNLIFLNHSSTFKLDLDWL